MNKVFGSFEELAKAMTPAIGPTVPASVLSALTSRPAPTAPVPVIAAAATIATNGKEESPTWWQRFAWPLSKLADRLEATSTETVALNDLDYWTTVRISKLSVWAALVVFLNALVCASGRVLGHVWQRRKFVGILAAVVAVAVLTCLAVPDITLPTWILFLIGVMNYFLRMIMPVAKRT